MKFLALIPLLTFLSCTHQKVKPEIVSAPEIKNPVATDSTANGKITASAIKTIQNQNICFDITLHIKDVERDIASANNWTTAWVDKKSRYYLLNISSRVPASIPQGSEKEWIAEFRSCVTRVKLDDVKSLVLTPKDLPYDDTNGLTLKWE